MSRSSRERWAQRHDQAGRLAQGYRQALTALDAGTATSPRGGVRVDLGARGVVARVSVSAGWRQECEPEELAMLIVATAGEAQAERVGRWAEATESPQGAVTGAEPIAEPAYQLRDMSGRRGDAALADAVREVGGLTEAVDELVESVTAVTTARHRGRSGSRHAVATVNGVSELVGLELDVDWLATAHSVNIGRESTQAIHDGLRLATQKTIESVVEDSRLGQLRQRLIDSTTITTTHPTETHQSRS